MGRKEQTTVNLSERAQSIKEDLAPVFGLKNILSAGLLLFSRLSDSEQKATIKEAQLAYDINDPEACIRYVNEQTEKAVAAEGKKGRERAKSAG